MVYRILTDNRKPVIARVRDLVGEKLVYTFMPRCSYEMPGISIEKNNTVVVGEDADQTIVDLLLAEELIALEEDMPGQDNIQQDPVEISESVEEDAVKEIPDLLQPVISLPLNGHSENSLRNLIFLLSSKGKLISKATGGYFRVGEELVDQLKENVNPTVENVKKIIKYNPSLEGLMIDDDRISFTGFPQTDDPEDIKIFMELADLMNKTALEQKRILPREKQEENEKYAFRTWLVRIGMDGPEYKAARKRLLRDLSGNSAFRTEADKEKWIQRQKERKEAGVAVSK